MIRCSWSDTVCPVCTAQELEPVFGRARDLCQEIGDIPQLFRVLSGLKRLYFGRAELQKTKGIGEQLLSLAQDMQDPGYLVGAYGYHGSTLYCLGDLAAARAHLEQSLSFFDRQQHDAQVFLHGANPVATVLSWTGLVLWELGYPDQALQRSCDALALARESEHPYTLGLALGFVPVLHQYRQEVTTTQEQAAAAVAYLTEQGFPYWLARARILHGWALAKQGQGTAGIAEIRRGIVDWQATGAALNMPYYLYLLAEAYGQDGQPCEGLHVIVAEALTIVPATEERLYEAELHRLKGNLLLMHSLNDNTEAESCFHHALAITRRQQAKSLELRAATSLSRLWQQQGKRQEAYDLLASVCGWFTEGFDTADLQEAKILLEELG
jgi:predicted ATPase